MKNHTNLFCIPFSGGSKYSYNEFIKHAPENLMIRSVELPGRGIRLEEPLISDIHELTEDIYNTIAPFLDTPYALYGHSMGARVVYLLAKMLREKNHNPPLHLFVSGSQGPSMRNQKMFHTMPEKEFKEELRSMGGVEESIFEDEELFQFFEPILRSDFKVVDTYYYQEAAPLNIPVTVMIGTEEDISYGAAKSWQNETLSTIDIYEFTGDHFFIYNHIEAILKMIHRKLELTLVQ